MIKCRVQLSASNVHHEAPFSNFLGLKKKKKPFILHLEVQCIYLVFIFLPIGHILIPPILQNGFSFHRTYFQFPVSQDTFYVQQ